MKDETIHMTPELVANLIECVIDGMGWVRSEDSVAEHLASEINEWFVIAGEKPDGPGYDGFRYE